MDTPKADSTEAFWKSDFGDAYTARCRVDWRARIPFWVNIIQRTGVRSVYEVGCNAGWNLSAIRCSHSNISVRGCDVNEAALRQATAAGLDVVESSAADLRFYEGGTHELVFTAGMLIHVPPEEIREAMANIVRISADYVLAVEYAATQEEAVEYRGHVGKLWRRPFGAMYRELGLETVEHGVSAPGFDRCSYWLMRKSA